MRISLVYLFKGILAVDSFHDNIIVLELLFQVFQNFLVVVYQQDDLLIAGFRFFNQQSYLFTDFRWA